MPAPYTPLAIANEFLARFSENDGIEHMKLQKLTYCAYGWWLAANGVGAVRLANEGPEIWKHGPVFPSLYFALRIFGRRPITEPQSSGPFAAPERFDENDDVELALISWVWGRYGHLSSFELSDLTHKPGTPWHRVAVENDYRVPFNHQIPDEYIFEEFNGLMTATRTVANAERNEDERNATA